MVIDTSAILAILFQEPEAERLARAIALAPLRLLSAASLVELGIVLHHRHGDEGARDLDFLVLTSRIEVVPVTERQATLARRAYRQYGKGLHLAGLNYGDCFAYALAKERGEPLLFKGEDFAHTDLAAADY